MSEDELKKYHHFKIKTIDGIELDLIETKYYEELLDLYQKEKERRKIAESKNAKVTLVLSNVLNELYNDTIPGAKTIEIKKLTGD